MRKNSGSRVNLPSIFYEMKKFTPDYKAKPKPVLAAHVYESLVETCESDLFI